MAKRPAKKASKKVSSKPTSKLTKKPAAKAASKASPTKKKAAPKAAASTLLKKAAKAVTKTAKKLVTKAAKKTAAPKATTKPTTKPAPKAATTKSPAPKKPAIKKPKPTLTTGVPTDVAEVEAQSRPSRASGRSTIHTAYEADENDSSSSTLSAADAAALDADIIAAATQPRDPSIPVRPHDVDRARAFAIAAARMCKDDKCEDILVLDVTKIRQDVDFIVIASGSSDRQMRSVLEHLEQHGEKMQNPAIRTSKDDRATWLLADFMDVVVHLFEPNTRAHYNLEMHFADAPKVAWEREGQQSRDRAGLLNVRNN
jgi:ribosome-associated protein